MTGPGCKKKGGKHRKHTPITSKAQRGKFGAELARRRAGKEGQMPGISTAELEQHLREAKGKNLPERRGGNMHQKAYTKQRREGQAR